MAELYLVEFKGSRKEYYYNSYYHSLNLTDHVITETDRGEDIGRLLQKIDTEVDFGTESKPRSILRPASDEDLQRMKEFRAKELIQRKEVIGLIKRHSLIMKVVDIESQFDGNKMTIFFTADHRVDFRELVKDLASRYRTRIELRQIGVRDEARRIGGMGICGKTQCCNSFIKEFSPISTQHAREQDLPLNPSKISGNCGRLLCCLKYEAEMYTQIKKTFPRPGTRVKTKSGNGVIERIDIFNEVALVRDEENLILKVKASDITEVGKGRQERIHTPSVTRDLEDEAQMDPRDRDRALKDLEDE